MPLPLVAAAPLAAGLLAYLAAKSDIGFDLKLLRLISFSLKENVRRENEGTLNMFYDLERHAQDPASASRVLIWFEGREVTFGEAYDQVLRYGNWLRTKFDIKPGEVVAVNCDNSIDFCILWFALWSIGAKPAFINVNLTLEPLAHCVRVSTAKLCIYQSQFAANMDAVKDQVGDVQMFEVSDQAHAEARACQPVRLPNEARGGQLERDLAMLIYTSGTTGLPKPAVVSWRKATTAAITVPLMSGVKPGDVMYSAMPMYHSLASVFGLLTATYNGHTVAIGRKFSNKTFWPDVRASKSTYVLYIGEAMRYLLAAPPQYDPVTGECLDKKHNVTNLIGSGMRPDVWTKVEKRFGIHHVAELYAATESTVSTWNLASNPSTHGAVGRAGWILKSLMWFSAPLVVVDWDKEAPWRDPKTGFCKTVPRGTPGELLSKLPVEDIGSVFQGYYANDKATDSKILRDVFTKGDAYFRTGDVLRWGDDGLLYFSDRLGDTFRWKGENVSTSEVSHMMGLHDTVHEANVYGVELPHHDGRAGCAAVTFSTGTPSQASLGELAAHLKKKLPKYAVPLFIRVVDEVGTASQTTGTNKQQKVNLRKQGVKPSGSPMFWLKGDAYVPFGDNEWKALNGGQVML